MKTCPQDPCKSYPNIQIYLFLDFFLRRQDSEKQIFWPTEETLNKIKKTGCHVVPKPSTKELYSYIHGMQIKFCIHFE